MFDPRWPDQISFGQFTVKLSFTPKNIIIAIILLHA